MPAAAADSPAIAAVDEGATADEAPPPPPQFVTKRQYLRVNTKYVDSVWMVPNTVLWACNTDHNGKPVWARWALGNPMWVREDAEGQRAVPVALLALARTDAEAEKQEAPPEKRSKNGDEKKDQQPQEGLAQT